MYRKAEPKNRNITVRVTKNQYNELNKIANSHDLSVSEWANHIISKHKNDYRKRENLEKLIYDTELEKLKTKLAYQILKKFQIETKTRYDKTLPLEILQMKLAIKILDITNFKSDETIDELIRNYHF